METIIIIFQHEKIIPSVFEEDKEGWKTKILIKPEKQVLHSVKKKDKNSYFITVVCIVHRIFIRL